MHIEWLFCLPYNEAIALPKFHYIVDIWQPLCTDAWWLLYPGFNKVERGDTGITLSVCPSVDRIVSALYLQQYSSDPFHICTSNEATSEGVSRVMPVSKLKKLKFWQIF